ncbi:uncharacterized protein LOC143024545 [Oratosquilla oratoria]|uniref:uncharacterized protein LOC143024545 n=1 Tax=Oratosquilla oratoria TaxID=337810 RepID=UPI003F75DFE7
MTARTTVMRAMCGRALGATYQVLRTYYVQAVRSSVAYAAPAIITVVAVKLQHFDPCQNDAARVILGAQRWNKALNLQREASLPPLQLRIRRLGADFVARALRSPSKTGLSRTIYISLECVDTPLHPNTWLSQAAKLLDSFQLRQPLFEKGIPKSHLDYECPPPWAPAPVTFKMTSLPGKKSACYPDSACVSAEDRIRALTRPGYAVYYTDGSVETTSPRAAGAAFVTDGCIFGRRVSDSASSLQPEAVAMHRALEHALVSHSNSVVIHIDSLTLMSCL